jgi:hypothetical protein
LVPEQGQFSSAEQESELMGASRARRARLPG